MQADRSNRAMMTIASLVARNRKLNNAIAEAVIEMKALDLHKNDLTADLVARLAACTREYSVPFATVFKAVLTENKEGILCVRGECESGPPSGTKLMLIGFTMEEMSKLWKEQA